MTIIETIDKISRETHDGTSKAHKKEWGQFFTPNSVATFMAGLPEADFRGREVKILDPGAGTGILGIAAADEALRRGASRVHLTAVEAESGALTGLRLAQTAARIAYGGRLRIQVLEEDFLALLQPTLGGHPVRSEFDIAISNPPYFKMSPARPHGGDAPNAYARFLEVAGRLLRPGGELVFIVPRSFSAGYYFRRFRRRIHTHLDLLRVHVFESRDRAFKRDSVLQENVIVHYRKQAARTDEVVISQSTCPETLGASSSLHVPRRLVFARPESDCVINLPSSAADIEVLRRVNSWPERLASLGLEISTGPVVPFRTDSLLDEVAAEAVPLLWLQHVELGRVRWPVPGFRKPQAIRGDAGEKLLVPDRTYVLLRRFSAKEDARRLTAAVYEAGTLPGDVLGLENHLNFIHSPGGELTVDLARGLVSLFALPVVDRFFAISNGNTQVSATEIRNLPLPPRDSVEALGRLADQDDLRACLEDPSFHAEALALLP